MENIAIHKKIISGMCRLCLSSDRKLIDMFSFSSELESLITDAVTKCTSVHVEKYTELPSTICEPCYIQLIKTQNFQMQAIKSDKILQSYLQRLQDGNTFGSSAIVQNCVETSCIVINANQDKEDNTNCEEMKPDVKYFEIGCEEPEMDIVENKVLALNSTPYTEWDGQSCNKDLVFNPNIIVKAEPIINDKEDQFDIDTETLNDFSPNPKLIKLENAVSDAKTIGSYQCDVCNKCFSDSDIFRKHQCSDSVGKPYRCDVCNKLFKCSNNLKDHQRVHTVHTGEKPYHCNICNKNFSKISNLRTHQRVHTGEKPYQCDVCNKCFNKISNLRTHQRVHTGEKPYQCDVCIRRFRDIGHMRRHQRSHTGEKPYKCNVCNKCFTLMNDLKRHERIHTDEKPYQCDVCNKCFRNAGDLTTHNRIHTGEKPYQCNVCNNSFSKISNLRAHQRIHTGEKPYQCDICNKSFTRLNSLNQHKTKHSSNVLGFRAWSMTFKSGNPEDLE